MPSPLTSHLLCAQAAQLLARAQYGDLSSCLTLARPPPLNPDWRLPPPGAETLRFPGGCELIVCYPPLGHYLRGAYTPENIARLHQELRSKHILDVPLTPAGLVRAGGHNDVAATFGYDAAWWRDTALIALGLDDQRSLALARGLASNAVSTNQVHRFVTGISRGAAVHDTADMPQIKINADGGDLHGRWGQNQLDALGLGLYSMVRYADRGPDLDAPLQGAALVTGYLARIDFTQVPCNGHWEEAGPNGKGSILTSSLGCVVHGMKALQRWIDEAPGRAAGLDGYLRSLDGTETGLGETLRTVRDGGELVFSFERGDAARAIARGVARLRERFVGGEWVETFDDPMGRRRGSDLALSTLALLELEAPPSDRIMSEDELVSLVTQLERDLKGRIGYRRYAGDGWIAAYPGADGAAPEPRMRAGLDIADRDKMIPGTSPEWTLGNGVMAHLYGKLYLELRDVRFRDKAIDHMNRLTGTITTKAGDPGQLEISELFMHVHEDGRYRYVPNGLDLNWSRAYVQLAMKTMRDVIAVDAQIKQSRHGRWP